MAMRKTLRKNGSRTDPFAFEFVNMGRFISAGRGKHETRTISDSELIFVTAGSLGIRVGDRAYDLGPGRFLLLPAGVEHGGTRPYSRDLAFYWIHMRPDEARQRAFPASGTAVRYEAVAFWCDALLSEQRVPGNEEVCNRLLALVFCELARPPLAPDPSEDETGRGGDVLASAARRQLRLEFRSSRCTTATIAAAIRCNPDYLGRVYRKRFGETLTETIESMRLAHAETLLRTTMLTIAQISDDAGYASPSYFRRRFKLRHSVSPKVWRKAHTDAVAHVNSV